MISRWTQKYKSWGLVGKKIQGSWLELGYSNLTLDHSETTFCGTLPEISPCSVTSYSLPVFFTLFSPEGISSSNHSCRNCHLKVCSFSDSWYGRDHMKQILRMGLWIGSCFSWWRVCSQPQITWDELAYSWKRINQLVQHPVVRTCGKTMKLVGGLWSYGCVRKRKWQT